MTSNVSLPPQPEVEWALLRLLFLSRSLPTQEAYAALADMFKLTSKQRSHRIDGIVRENAWENLCRYARRRLVDDGLLEPLDDRSRGNWSISEEGDRVSRLRGPVYNSLSADLDL